MLRLMHLSDIHFKTPQCLNKRMDRDSQLRDRIVADAKQIVDSTGESVDAILVTGDIAFKADPEEFEVAKEWLQQAAVTLGADKNAIYVVPGNHDVDRNIADKRAVKGVRDSILREEGERRIDEFMGCLRDTESAKLLMLPLDAYNEFAKSLACDIWPPNRPFWEHELPITDQYTLRLNGLTSVFFSGKDDERGNLFMGSFQTNISKPANIINLVMFHHPTDWLKDGDEIDDDLQENAHIRLVGHKHSQRARPDDYGVTFSAAAVNPSRHETDYDPGYNILDISVIDDDEPILNIDAHLRCLQKAPIQFVPIRTREGSEIFNYQFKLEKTVGQYPSPVASAPPPDIQNIEVPEMNQKKTPNKRDMLIRFWSLSSGQRRTIVNKLDLLNQEELALPDFERYHLAFQNADEQNKFDALFSAIEEEMSL